MSTASESGGGTALPSLGTCFGLSIRSRLPFEYLRPGVGRRVDVLAARPGETLGATERLQTWPGVPGVRAVIHLNRCGDSAYGIGVGEADWFRCDLAAATFTLSSADPYREALFWGTPAAVAMALHGDLVLHAASVEVDGAGILLIAPGGTGKTTMAAAFHAAGHRLLSDDLAGCRPGPPPVVLPGPPLVRLRRDAAAEAAQLGLSMTRDYLNRVHAVIEPLRRGSADPVPLRVMVLLDGDSGPLSVGFVPPADALRDLYATSFWLPFEADRVRSFQGLGDLVSRVPVIRLRRPREWAALPETVAFLVDHVSSL